MALEEDRQKDRFNFHTVLDLLKFCALISFKLSLHGILPKVIQRDSEGRAWWSIMGSHSVTLFIVVQLLSVLDFPLSFPCSASHLCALVTS